MPPDSFDQPRSVAIEQLEGLGLSAYAARTFVALRLIGDATAQEVSEVVDVPRTRVYDAAEELGERGLVDIQQSSPKRFWAVSAETAGRQFHREYSRRVDRLVEALGELGPVSTPEEQRGVRTVTSREAISDRVHEFIGAANDEVVYMTVEKLLSDEVVADLREASDRGVDVRLGTMSERVEDDIHASVPDADVFDSLWNWAETPAGRVLMADKRRTLVSVLVPSGDDRSVPREETAIWGSGEANGLVVVLKTMFTWQLDGNRSREE